MAKTRNTVSNVWMPNYTSNKASTSGRRGTAQGTYKGGRVTSTSGGKFAKKSQQRYNIEMALRDYELDANGNLVRSANRRRVP